MTKLITLLYLEDDEPVVDRLLRDAGIGAFSRLEMEGHGSGFPGWDGTIPSFRSRLIFAMVDAQRARDVLDAVAAATGVQDSSHPIRAFQVDVEAVARSGLPDAPPAMA
jgi:hypothetical protein